MTMRRTDRSKLKDDFTSKLWSKSDQCQDIPDEKENELSSIPIKHYNQQHCAKAKMMKMFQAAHNCTFFPMFATYDLNFSLPLCNRSNAQNIMTMKNMMMKNNSTLLKCPAVCIEEHVDTGISFTILSEEQVETSSIAWNLTKLSKDEIVLMELFFTSLQTQVGQHY